MMTHFLLVALLGTSAFGATLLRAGPYAAPIPAPYGAPAPVLAQHAFPPAAVSYYSQAPVPVVAQAPPAIGPVPIAAAHPPAPYATSYTYATHINHAVPTVNIAPAVYAPAPLPRFAPAPVAYGPPVQPTPAFRHLPHAYPARIPLRPF